MQCPLVSLNNGTVPASVRALVSNGVDALSKSDGIKYISSHCTDLEYTVRSNKTYEHIFLDIQHEGDISGYIRSTFYRPIQLKVHLKKCPTGFKIDSECTKNKKSAGMNVILICCQKQQNATLTI